MVRHEVTKRHDSISCQLPCSTSASSTSRHSLTHSSPITSSPILPYLYHPHIPIDKVDQKEVSSFFLYSSKIKTQKHAVKSHHKASNTRLPPTPHPALGSTRLSGCYVPSSLAPHCAPPLITLARGQNRQRLPGGANTNDGPPSYSCKRRRETRPPLAPVGRSLHNKDSCSGQS